MAAIVGIGSFSIDEKAARRRTTKRRASSGVIVFRSFRSAPAQKAFPPGAERTTTTLASPAGIALISWMQRSRSLSSFLPIEFFLAALLRTSCTTPYPQSSSISALVFHRPPWRQETGRDGGREGLTLCLCVARGLEESFLLPHDGREEASGHPKTHSRHPRSHHHSGHHLCLCRSAAVVRACREIVIKKCFLSSTPSFSSSLPSDRGNKGPQDHHNARRPSECKLPPKTKKPRTL